MPLAVISDESAPVLHLRAITYHVHTLWSVPYLVTSLSSIPHVNRTRSRRPQEEVEPPSSPLSEYSEYSEHSEYSDRVTYQTANTTHRHLPLASSDLQPCYSSTDQHTPRPSPQRTPEPHQPPTFSSFHCTYFLRPPPPLGRILCLSQAFALHLEPTARGCD